MQFASNPSSKWLDRLRRSKGFPANSGEDLDHFLSHQNTHLPNFKTPQISANPNPNPNPLKQDLSSVLFDLFSFGESNDDPLLNSKKGIRKQKKPRFCVVSRKDDEAEDDAVTRLMREENGDFGEREGCDFVGFSRTNVTVIDTSYPWWKCERVVFRKKNLWRVRDKKSKSTNVGGKKRKSKTLPDEKDGSRKRFKMLGSSEEGNKQNETINTNIEESDDILSQVQNQRFPRKSKKGGASDAVLIKNTLTSKKNGIISLRTDGS